MREVRDPWWRLWARAGWFGVAEGERGQRDRAGPASILLRRGFAVKAAVKACPPRPMGQTTAEGGLT
jgi:hypothetical protein